MGIKKAGPGILSRSGTSVPAFSYSSAMIFPVDFREHLCYDGHNETAKMEEACPASGNQNFQPY